MACPGKDRLSKVVKYDIENVLEKTKTKIRTGTRRNIYVTKLGVHQPCFQNHPKMHIFIFHLQRQIKGQGQGEASMLLS